MVQENQHIDRSANAIEPSEEALATIEVVEETKGLFRDKRMVPIRHQEYLEKKNWYCPKAPGEKKAHHWDILSVKTTLGRQKTEMVCRHCGRSKNIIRVF